MYYLRSRPAADAIKFTLDVESLLNESNKIKEEKENILKQNQEIQNKENLEEIMPPLKKLKTEENSKKKTVCGDDICLSCGS